MDADIDGQEMPMAILNGLAEEYENIIVVLHALSDDNRGFTFELVKTRLLQEEQGEDMTHQNENNASKAAALFGSSSLQKPSGTSPFECTFSSRKGNSEDRCWDEHPAMKPKHLYIGEKITRDYSLLWKR